MKRIAKVVVALAALALGGTACAQGASHQHDGFFFRPELGVAYLKSSASQQGNDFAVYGGAADLSVAVGGAVAENLILAAHLYSTAASNPDVELNGVKGSTSDTTNGLVGIGPQITYYFMPVNLYLSGTLALTRIVTKSNGVEGKTDFGLGARFAVGKEWWVSDNWGLGIAAHLGLSSNKDQGAGAPTVGTWTSGISFSATYN
jgi:hypothetical protein